MLKSHLIKNTSILLCLVASSFSLYYCDSKIEEELDNENGIIYRRIHTTETLEQITGFNKPDMVDTSEFIYDLHERIFGFSLSEAEANQLIYRFKLQFCEINSLKNLTNTINYKKIPLVCNSDKSKNDWAIYNKIFTKDELFSIVHGFDSDHGARKYRIELLVNKKINYGFLKIKRLQ